MSRFFLTFGKNIFSLYFVLQLLVKGGGIEEGRVYTKKQSGEEKRKRKSSKRYILLEKISERRGYKERQKEIFLEIFYSFDMKK